MFSETKIFFVKKIFFFINRLLNINIFILIKSLNNLIVKFDIFTLLDK